MGSEEQKKDRKEKPSFVAAHDSATAMVQALADFLHGRAFEGVGAVPSSELYADLVNSIPASWRKKLYTWSGKFGAISHRKVGQIDASEIDQWVCDLYPQKKYPAIAIGSSNGAAIHLCAAMGIPWLPQTILVPVDKGTSFPVDEPKKTMEWGKEPVREFLTNNEDWQMHHMMDPNQDRLRVGEVAYFRIKKTILGQWYERFLKERLEENGRIILIDCGFSWPVYKIGERHYFQLGGLGGLSPEEYYHGSEKVQRFLEEAGSNVTQWDAPQPNCTMPEAEWGLENSLAEDIRSFAAEKDIAQTTISFDHPQDLSTPVANFYRRWYRSSGDPADRLLVGTFNLISPYLSIQKRCVPYWLAFIVDQSAADLEAFLDEATSFEEIYMMVLSHGKDSAGRTAVSRWESLMERATGKHSFIGTDPEEYPIDMAVYARYSRDLQKTIKSESPIPSPMDVEQAFRLLEELRGQKMRLHF